MSGGTEMRLTADSQLCGFCGEVRFRGMGVCPFHGAAAKASEPPQNAQAARQNPSKSLAQYQAEIRAWQLERFPEEAQDDWVPPLLGLMEELGELAHAMLKQRQRIRLTPEEWEVKGKDAVADILIFLLNFCNRRGWNAEQLLQQTWDEVRKRTYPKVEEA